MGRATLSKRSHSPRAADGMIGDTGGTIFPRVPRTQPANQCLFQFFFFKIVFASPAQPTDFVLHASQSWGQIIDGETLGTTITAWRSPCPRRNRSASNWRASRLPPPNASKAANCPGHAWMRRRGLRNTRQIRALRSGAHLCMSNRKALCKLSRQEIGSLPAVPLLGA